MTTGSPPNHRPAIRTVSEWTRLLLGVLFIFILFHGSATLLGSDRGQAGLVVGALIVGATILAERSQFGGRVPGACRFLGLGRPHVRGMIVAMTVCALLLLIIALFPAVTGTPIELTSDWIWLWPGLFAQAGVAEEILFRGYLFGHLRVSRTFWSAAGLSMIPFVLAHLLLFFTMSWPIAAASVLLSALLSIPFARLFELGGKTIWPPAVLHTIMQGTLKVVVIPEAWTSSLPIVWMLASALLTLPILFVRNSSDVTEAPLK